MRTDDDANQHRKQHPSHKIVFVSDKERLQATHLSYFIHNLLVARKSPETIIKAVELQFGKDLDYNSIFRLDSTISSNKQYQRRENDPSDSIDNFDPTQSGYENSTIPRVHDVKFEKETTAKNDEVYLDHQKMSRSEWFATHGKGYLTRISGQSGPSRAQFESSLDARNYQRREKNVWKAVEKGLILKELAEMYLSGELPLPRGRKGGRRSKNQTVPIEEGREGMQYA